MECRYALNVEHNGTPSRMLLLTTSASTASTGAAVILVPSDESASPPSIIVVNDKLQMPCVGVANETGEDSAQPARTITFTVPQEVNDANTPESNGDLASLTVEIINTKEHNRDGSEEQHESLDEISQFLNALSGCMKKDDGASADDWQSMLRSKQLEQVTQGESFSWYLPRMRSASIAGMANNLSESRPTSMIESMPDEFLDTVVKKRRRKPASKITHDYKDKLVQHELDLHKDEFTEFESITICVGTFNVNGKHPKGDSSAEMLDWLVDGIDGCPDIYAVGLEEMDLSREAFVRNNSNQAELWTPAIEAAISVTGSYKKVMAQQLVGILVVVYAKTSILGEISDVDAAYTGTGVMGMMGNKGGVTVRLKMYAGTICFVCAHLAARADAERCQRRNQDYHQIMAKTELIDSADRSWAIQDHDLVFFFGDLNYRIDELTYEETKAQLLSGAFLQLLHVEQLTREKAAGRVLEGFSEPEITFMPTYKYEPGTDDFDTKKLQTPSWCDRILYKGKISPLSYTSHHKFKISDHKPVRAVFIAKVAKINQEKHASVLQSVLRNLDAIENESMPDASISTNQCDFGKVRYLQEKSQQITISNTGKVVLRFSFKPKPDEFELCKPWLSISPSTGVIGPGQSLTVTLSLCVNNQCTSHLNTKKDSLDDIVILHLVNGREYFISVTGQWIRTSFCTDFTELVYLKSSAASIEPGESIHELETPLLVPKELWLLTNHLINISLGEGESIFDLFSEGVASELEVHKVIECLDSGDNISAEPHAIAEVYFRFLDACPGGIIPESLQKRCFDARSSYSACRQVINRLDPVTQEVFLYVSAFLRNLIERTSMQRPEANTEALRGNFAILFGSALFKSGSEATTSTAKKQAQFLAQFLANPDVVDS